MTSWIVVAKLLTGGLQYCMFKIVFKYRCAAPGEEEEEFKSHVFLTFVTCFAMLVVIAPFFYQEIYNRRALGIKPTYPYTRRAHLLTIMPAILEVTGMLVSLTANTVLDASVMVLLKSIRIPVSAFMNKYIVGRSLHLYQKAAVFITILGIIPVMCSETFKDKSSEAPTISPYVAFIMVAVAEVFKGIRYVYEERLIKIEKLSSEFLVFMQSLIDTLISIGFIVVYHLIGQENWFGTWGKLSNSPGLWLLLIFQILLTGFHNYTSTLITEKLSSLHNVLISQGRVVVTAVFMIIIERFFRCMGEKLGWNTAINSIGYVLFVLAALLYNGNVRLPWKQCYPEEDKMVSVS